MHLYSNLIFLLSIRKNDVQCQLVNWTEAMNWVLSNRDLLHLIPSIYLPFRREWVTEGEFLFRNQKENFIWFHYQMNECVCFAFCILPSNMFVL